MQMHASYRVLAAGLLAFVPEAFGQGADVMTGDISGPFAGGGFGPRRWGTLDGVTSYSFGTTSCNIGDVPLNWISPGNQHPVIAMNMYRLMNGRFEQVGMSWVKHGLCALQHDVCQPCTPAGAGCEDSLGVGCSDPYGSTLNGQQAGMGPRSEINASTGAFAWPYSTRGQIGNTLYKRIQVPNSDFDPENNGGARYFAEAQYVAADDAAAGNSDNNASYRPFEVSDVQTNGGWELNWTDDVVRGDPALLAWRDHGLGPGQADSSVQIDAIDVPGDGRFLVGVRVSNNMDGTWHYEYAIQNLDSDRSAGRFAVSLGASTVVTNVGFRDIDYHGGEPYDNTDWIASEDVREVSWTSPESFGSNPNSNALRWGTIYNFWFDSSAPPVTGKVEIGLFKPGVPSSELLTTQVPGEHHCWADWDVNGSVNTGDFLAFLNDYNYVCHGQPAVYRNPDIAPAIGFLNTADFLLFITTFAAGCP